MKRSLFSGFLIGLALLLGVCSGAFVKLPQQFVKQQALSPMRMVNSPGKWHRSYTERHCTQSDDRSTRRPGQQDVADLSRDRPARKGDLPWAESRMRPLPPRADATFADADWRDEFRFYYGDIGR